MSTVTRRQILAGSAVAAGAAVLGHPAAAHADDGASRRPNIVYIMTDDHAAHAVSAYGSRINSTPNIDRIAENGIRFENAFCTNSICVPSRASVLTGTYSHINGCTTLDTLFDATQTTFPALLQSAGYRTAIFGKWHLGHGGIHDPHGFDDWAVLRGQGPYFDPELLTPNGPVRYEGYTTDIITDVAIDWLDRQNPEEPFCLLVHQKAPHRPWRPDDAHADLYEDPIPQPPTLYDDHSGQSEAARSATNRVSRDLTGQDLKQPVPDGLTPQEETAWKYQRFLEDYLRCIASVDDNVGRLLDHLDEKGLTDNTVVVYTSDQGFFLGDHGWFDKRFMYEESLRQPLLIRWPGKIPAGITTDAMALNIDFAETFLEIAGVSVPERMQGRSLTPLFRGHVPGGWRTSLYYRYWMHDDGAHHVRAHYGVRTERYKLIYYYNQGLGQAGASGRIFAPEWELFDLRTDPHELRSVHDDPGYAQIRADLERELKKLQRRYGDEPAPEVDIPTPPPLTGYGPVEAPYRTFTSAEASFLQKGDAFSVVTTGRDMWQPIDEYAAVYLPGAGHSGSVATATVTYQEPTDARSKAGLVFRNSVPGAGSSGGYVVVGVTPGNNIVMNWDNNGNGLLENAVSVGATSYPVTLRLARDGQTYTGSYSTDSGATWQTIRSVTLASAASIQDVGLVATAHHPTDAARADFDEFGVVGE